MRTIKVVGARANNLRDVTVEIPKGLLTVVTGVSGSGKSSLVFGTIAAEAQRQLGETMPAFVRNRLAHHGRPEVDALEHLTAAIVVDQRRIAGNVRSTVGTATEIAPVLRLLYSRLSTPHVGFSPAFSFNDPSGMCPRCAGLGEITDIDVERLLDRERSLAEGAIRFSGFAPRTYRWQRLVTSGLFDNDKALRDYTAAEWETLLHADGLTPPHPLPGWPPSSTFAGVVTRFRRSYLEGGQSRIPARVAAEVAEIVTARTCPECAGERLTATARAATVAGATIAECARMEVGELAAFLRTLTEPVAAPMVAAMVERLDMLVEVGLGHLTLARATPTLSGGEAQRITLVRHLGSSLTDLTYMLDEPSAGLHPHDVGRLLTLLKGLRDKGNTVLVVEHDQDVIAAADHVIDMGPGAGAAGGTVVYAGEVAGLRRAATPTGGSLRARREVRQSARRAGGHVRIVGARRNNLRGVDVEVPLGVLTVVTGVAGSGKSTLATQVLPAVAPEAVVVDQTPLRGSVRSSPASYLGILEPLRAAFARVHGVAASLFHPRCPGCRGRGEVETDLAFLDPVRTECELCDGTGFTAEALRHRLGGATIAEVLATPTVAALDVLPQRARPAARRLVDVGLGYLTLGRPVSTLSGGERQRLRLAARPDGGFVVLDEPTAGLHATDVGGLIALFDRMVDAGATLVVVEHDLDVVAAADWVIELGPGAGRAGGEVLYAGVPRELVGAPTATGRHLARPHPTPVAAG